MKTIANAIAKQLSGFGYEMYYGRLPMDDMNDASIVIENSFWSTKNVGCNREEIDSTWTISFIAPTYNEQKWDLADMSTMIIQSFNRNGYPVLKIGDRYKEITNVRATIMDRTAYIQFELSNFVREAYPGYVDPAIQDLMMVLYLKNL